MNTLKSIKIKAESYELARTVAFNERLPISQVMHNAVMSQLNIVKPDYVEFLELIGPEEEQVFNIQDPRQYKGLMLEVARLMGDGFVFKIEQDDDAVYITNMELPNEQEG